MLDNVFFLYWEEPDITRLYEGFDCDGIWFEDNWQPWGLSCNIIPPEPPDEFYDNDF